MSNFRFSRSDHYPIVKNLVIINVLVFLAQTIFDNQYHLTDVFTLQPIVSDHLREALLQNVNPPVSVRSFSPYQIFTHMFTHAPFPMVYHILFNMLVLWMFGRVLESAWGSKRFLTFYLVCGIGAAVFHLVIQYLRAEYLLYPAVAQGDQAGFDKYYGALAGAVGASGAIMGVMAAFAYLFPNTPLYIMFLPVPVKAKWAILGYVALDLFGGFGVIKDNVAHFAHLGGALTGFILVLIWNKTNRRTFY